MFKKTINLLRKINTNLSPFDINFYQNPPMNNHYGLKSGAHANGVPRSIQRMQDEEEEEKKGELSIMIDEEPPTQNKALMFHPHPERIQGYFCFRQVANHFRSEPLVHIHDQSVIEFYLESNGNSIWLNLTSHSKVHVEVTLTVRKGFSGLQRTEKQKFHLQDLEKLTIDNCRQQLNDEAIVEFELDFNEFRSDDLLSENFGKRGLVNEGNTCYINSLLQLLQHLPPFKRLVYGINQIQVGKFPASLQEVFYELDQNMSDPVRITALLKSFDWTQEDAWVQQDVQEFFLRLIEALDDKLKSISQDSQDSQILVLFKGTLENTITCKYVDDVSRSTQTFIDLQLEVKDQKSLRDSITKYVQSESLIGDNQFVSDKHGRQDAMKESRFTALPPVLICHLKRFAYEGGRMKKILDRYEFQDKLKLLDQDYELYAILVHMGERLDGGHYYAYIKDILNDQWVKFNDQIVKVVSKLEAVDGNFGGTSTVARYDTVARRVVESQYQHRASAYMLVYIQREQINLQRISKQEIPGWIHDKIKMKEQREIQQKIISENLTMSFTKFTNIESGIYGLLFQKNSANYILTPERIEKMKESCGARSLSSPLKSKFVDFIKSKDLYNSQVYLYRALKNSGGELYAEIFMPINKYYDLRLTCLRNAMDDNRYFPMLVEIETKPFYGEHVLIFTKLIDSQMRVENLEPILESSDIEINGFVQSHFPHLVNYSCLVQDPYFRIYDSDRFINDPLSYVFHQLKTTSHITLILLENSIKESTLNELMNLPQEFQVFNESLQLLGTIRVDVKASYEQLMEELLPIVNIEKDLMLVKYWNQDDWLPIDIDMLNELISSEPRHLISRLLTYRNELIVSKHPIKFQSRCSVSLIESALFFWRQGKMDRYPISMQYRENDSLGIMVQQSIDHHAALIQDNGYDPQQRPLVLLFDLHQSYLCQVQTLEKLLFRSVRQLISKHRIYLCMQESQVSSFQKYLIICNFKQGYRYDTGFDPFWHLVEQDVTVSDVTRLIKEHLALLDLKKYIGNHLYACDELSLNGKNLKRITDEHPSQIFKEWLGSLYQSGHVYLDVELISSQELKLHI